MNKTISNLIEDFFYDDGKSKLDNMNYGKLSTIYNIFIFAGIYTLPFWLLYGVTVYSAYILCSKRLRYLKKSNSKHIVFSLFPIINLCYMSFLSMLKLNNTLLIYDKLIKINENYSLVSKWVSNFRINNNDDVKVNNIMYVNDNYNKCLYTILYEPINGFFKNMPAKGYNYIEINNNVWKCKKTIMENAKLSAFRLYDESFEINENKKIVSVLIQNILNNGTMLVFMFEEILDKDEKVNLDDYNWWNYIDKIIE